jgi:hypothetical protein
VEALYGYASEIADPARPLNLMNVASAPLPPAPLEAGCSLHWLAVDGAQPELPQNTSKSKRLRSGSISGSKISKPSEAPIQIVPAVKHEVSSGLRWCGLPSPPHPPHLIISRPRLLA